MLERFLAYFGLWPDLSDPPPTPAAHRALPVTERSDPSVRATTPSNATRHREPLARIAARQRTAMIVGDAPDRAVGH
jgi:hypothetical protein